MTTTTETNVENFMRGPRNPNNPTSELMVATRGIDWVIYSLEYEDGTLYQLKMERFSSLMGMVELEALDEVFLLSTHDPRDVGDAEDFIYVTAWKSNQI